MHTFYTRECSAATATHRRTCVCIRALFGGCVAFASVCALYTKHTVVYFCHTTYEHTHKKRVDADTSTHHNTARQVKMLMLTTARCTRAAQSSCMCVCEMWTRESACALLAHCVHCTHDARQKKRFCSVGCLCIGQNVNVRKTYMATTHTLHKTLCTNCAVHRTPSRA